MHGLSTRAGLNPTAERPLCMPRAGMGHTGAEEMLLLRKTVTDRHLLNSPGRLALMHLLRHLLRRHLLRHLLRELDDMHLLHHRRVVDRHNLWLLVHSVHLRRDRLVHHRLLRHLRRPYKLLRLHRHLHLRLRSSLRRQSRLDLPGRRGRLAHPLLLSRRDGLHKQPPALDGRGGKQAVGGGGGGT